MSALDRLRDLAAALARRRALALVLAALAVFGAAATVAAVLARLGALSQLRFVPLLLWLGVVGGGAWVVRAVRRYLAAQGHGALRDTAALVEHELVLRRGTFVGLVDLSRSPASGTSDALVSGAARRLAARLPAGGAEAWLPRGDAALVALVRRRAVAALVCCLAGVFSLVYAGDAAATLVSPLRALRAAVRPRVVITVSRDVVHAGESVAVTVEAEAGASSAALYIRRTGEPWRPIRLSLDPAGRATEQLADIRSATFVYAAFEGRTSDTLDIRVVAPLVLGEFSATAHYPGYLRRADEELDPASGPLSLPVGTMLELRGGTNAPLARALLVSGRDTAALHHTATGFEGRLAVRASTVWNLALTDRAGAALPEPLPTLDIRAIPDSAPVVTVPVPGADTTMPIDLRAAIVVDARDDHGLARAEVVSWRVSRLGVVGDTVVEAIPGVSGADRVVQSQLLDLTSRGLLPGDTLRYFVRATDAAPAAHSGRSRAYALRLRSMAEMREAVRLGTDSLAAQAAELARDQQAVERRTEDLAAQRNRAGDQTQRPTDPRRGSEQARENNTGTNQFEQNAEAQRVAEQQQALLERADSLRAELERLTEAADQAGLNDPQWREQLRNLEELLRQAMTPELQRQLEQLQRALQQLDSRGVQEALRNLAQRQQELREQLQRSAELFERAAIEGAMQTFAENAQQLSREQQEWADRAPARQDSAAAASEERQLAREADSLGRNMEQLEQRLGARGDSAAQQRLDQTGQRVESAQQAMQQAAQAMQQGQRSEAAQQGRQAAQQMQQAQQEMEQTQQQMSQQWREQVERLLNESTQETVSLANEEQRLSRELRRGEGARDARGRQSAMEQGINQVLQRLQQASGQNALVSPRLGNAMAQAREQIAQSRQALEGPSPSVDEAAERAGDAAQILSAAAVQMMRNANDVNNAQSGSGYAEAMQRMAQMAGQQGQLNDELGGLLPMMGQGQEQMMQQLRQLAARQRSLANQIERLNDAGVPGNPQAMAEEARQLADRIEQARLDRATLERQQRLFRRMLDAGRSLRNDEQPEDPERQSRTAENAQGHTPTSTARPGTLRYTPPSWSDLRQLAPSERAMVLDYFRRLNTPVPTPEPRANP